MAPSLPLATGAIRTVTCCSACGETACDHDADLVEVVLDSSWRTRPAASATTLTTAQIDTVRAWLDSVTARGAELTWHERDLLTACTDAQDQRIVRRWFTDAARAVVADAFNALQRGA